MTDPIEIMMKGACRANCRSHGQECSFCNIHGMRYTSDAKAMLDALDSAGFVIVPREPTAPASPWTPVKDGLPEGMHNVLMTIEGVMYTVSGIKSSDDKWYDDNGNEILNKVIAWMLTPHPY